MQEIISSKQKIYYYFKELGIIIYGEYILKQYQNNGNYMENLLENYISFINNENNIPSKINHKICYYYFKHKQSDDDDDDEYNDKIIGILSKINEDLDINYFNFILICNLIHYYVRFFEHIDNKESSFLLYQLKKFSNLILNNNEINNEGYKIIMVYLFFYYYSLLLYRLFKHKSYNLKPINNANINNFLNYIKSQIDILYKAIHMNNNMFEILDLKYLSNYAEKNNKEILNIYISFIKYFISINDRKYKETKDFYLSFYDDFKLTNEIKFGLLSRKLLYIIYNYDEKIIEKQLKNILKICKNKSNDYFICQFNNENINNVDNINNNHNEENIQNENHINENNVIENNIIENNIIENNIIENNIIINNENNNNLENHNQNRDDRIINHDIINIDMNDRNINNENNNNGNNNNGSNINENINIENNQNENINNENDGRNHNENINESNSIENININKNNNKRNNENNIRNNINKDNINENTNNIKNNINSRNIQNISKSNEIINSIENINISNNNKIYNNSDNFDIQYIYLDKSKNNPNNVNIENLNTLHNNIDNKTINNENNNNNNIENENIPSNNSLNNQNENHFIDNNNQENNQINENNSNSNNNIQNNNQINNIINESNIDDNINNNNNNENNINNNNKIYTNINYIEDIIESNKCLLNNEARDYDCKEKKILLYKNQDTNLPISLDKYKEYHKYNIKNDKEKLILKEEEIGNNIFLKIISKHNKIMILSKELSKSNESDKDSNKEKTYDACFEFIEYIRKDEIKKYIINNYYLKILISRVLYNYMELIYLDKIQNKNKNAKIDDKFKIFESIVDELKIDNYLIDKIYGDYYFIVNDNKEKAKDYYDKYKDEAKSNSVDFTYAICLYLIEKNRNSKNISVLNQIDEILSNVKACFTKKNNTSNIKILEKIRKDIKDQKQ